MAIPATWIAAFARDSLGDIEMTPEIDADLSHRALNARTDPAERERLFALLAWKTDRFCARFRRWSLEPWELDDVRQEAYIVFVEVIESWRPLEGNGGPAGFGYFYLRVFPLRLADRVRKMIDRMHPLPWRPEHDTRLDPADLDDAGITATIVAEICGRLNAADATIFHLRLADVTTEDSARLTGISRRTLHRHWPRIVSISREVWEAVS